MITIYKTSHCPYCINVQKLCERYGKEYELVSLDDNPEIRQELINKTHAMTVPITTNGKDYVIGRNPKKLVELLR